MIVLTVVVAGAAIVLTWMIVHAYTRPENFPTRPRAGRSHGGRGGSGDHRWVFAGSDAGASDCSAGDGGGGCGGDGGGGGGGD